MYRTFLKVNKVGLRIKENVEIQIAIKKGNENFFMPKTALLDKCVAVIDSQSEFFV